MKQTPWTADKANAWYRDLPWPIGCNYIPHHAINQLEMWQAESFNPGAIDIELGWAEDIGFNTLRVFLHDVAWEIDPDGFKDRIDDFLSICKKHRIRPLLVLFDDCWNPGARPGKQRDPVPGIHNSGWLQSPGIQVVNDPATWPRLKEYVTGILSSFAGDGRILMWDLYNEPGNSKQEEKSLPLLREVFDWARDVNPSQPLTCGIWNQAPGFAKLNTFQIKYSDIITFHNYEKAGPLQEIIAKLRDFGRPLICTEYVARPAGSTFQEILPIFKREGIGAINWGFVAGRTNTIYEWGSKKGAPEPALWFHDLFRPDGTPFDPGEIRLIKDLATRQP